MEEDAKHGDILYLEPKLPTIKTASTTNKNPTQELLPNIVTSSIDSRSRTRNLATCSEASSPYYSPLISPPSSAFVSALQSPYVSPRINVRTDQTSESATPSTTLTLSSPPVSYSGSHSDDIPSTSYTPPPERYDFFDDSSNTKLKIVTCVPLSGPDTAPRVSFSFPVPRVSFVKGSVSPNPNAKLRSCDVYIGHHGQNPNLVRFCKWLKSELELQGIACFVADRAKYVDTQSHEIADRVICSVAYGVVVLTNNSLLNHFTLEEIRFFAQKKNLIPLFFNTDAHEILSMFNRHSDNKELKEAVDGLMKCQGSNLVANEGNLRSCVSKTSGILTSKLGRKSVTAKEIEVLEELPFPRNRYFVGRQKEIAEIETMLFGGGDCFTQEGNVSVKEDKLGEFEDVAEDELEVEISRGKYLNLELGRCKEPNLEAWVEPVIGISSQKRPRCKKSKSGKYKSSGSSVVCINGLSGIGKTELALEYAHMYSLRYKMVLWVGGDARHFRQNILNLSLKLWLDVSADTEKDRGRIRSFDEQENEAFKRVKRELFRDLPYLLIIDNLESEKEWWEGKDLHDLIPRNTGGTHVIITTRLSKVMNLDPMHLQPLPLSDAMIMIRGRRGKEYSSEECEYLKMFDEKLGRLTFGLSLVGSLLSELAISPSALFEAINETSLEGVANCTNGTAANYPLFLTNPFLIKVLSFCAAVLQPTNGSRNHLAAKMLQVGAWFAPSPVSANVLATAATYLPASKNRLGNWSRCMKQTFLCGSSCLTSQSWKIEEDSALLLEKLGLARRANVQPGCWVQFHDITQVFAKSKDGLVAAKAMVEGVRKGANAQQHQHHLWASAFLVFGFKSEPPLVPLNAIDMVLFIKKTTLPLAIGAFTAFSRCNTALELLKVCTNVLEEVEKSFVTQIQDWCHGSLCWKKAVHSHHKVDEHVWQEVTLLKATLLEARAKLLMRGGQFDNAEELCRTCISIRTVMLGHNNAQTLGAQETLATLVRMRCKTQH